MPKRLLACCFCGMIQTRLCAGVMLFSGFGIRRKRTKLVGSDPVEGVDWKKILLVLPVFAYNFGTALLLTGYADIARFCCYTRLIFPFLLIIMLKNTKEGGAGTQPAQAV